MAINVSAQYNGGFLPDMILLNLCYYHRRTRLNAMNRYLSLQLMIPPERFTRRTTHELTELCCLTLLSGVCATQLCCITHPGGSMYH